MPTFFTLTRIQLKTFGHLYHQSLSWINSAFVFISFLVCWSAHGATLPANFAETRLATGLDPTGMEFAPDGRLFVTEKSGRIRIVKFGSLLPTPFLTLSVNNSDERGLQSIAFDPDFANNQYVYVYYTTATSPIHNRVSRFKANGDVALPGSETILLELDNLQGSNHNGGALFFSGGKLFITTGENGIFHYSQSLENLLGKILRINPDGSIPTDNPYYNVATGKNRAIWAIGLRHPFRATVQPGTGRIFIGDVGGADYEEINEGFAGKNYGWPAIEGPRTNQTPPANYQDPVYSYSHSIGCAITGGAFYNPPTNQFPANYVGKYFFADYCNGYIKTLDVSNGGAVVGEFATGINRAISVKVGPDGSLYYLARGGLGGNTIEDNTSSSQGEVWRVQYTGSNVPTISAQPINQVAQIGANATFTVGASGSDLTYQWQRNGVNINGATSSSYTHSPVVQEDNGAVFRVVVSNSSGSVTSNGATLTVTTNRNPTVSILSPANGSLYRAGDVITFNGSATDPEDGNLPASAFNWYVDFHHAEHTHPGPEPILAGDGRSGNFTIPTIGHTESNVWYRLYLVVTDAQGGVSSTYVDINPKKVTLNIATNPTGLQVTVEGKNYTSPYTETFVSGVALNLNTPRTQNFNGSVYTFSGWTPDIGNGQIAVPNDNTTYTANFTVSSNALRNPENPSNAVAGLNYQYYEGSWPSLPDFGSLTPIKAGTTPDIDLSVSNRAENYALRFRGYVRVPADGLYTFYTKSDDGSKLFIGSTEVVNNDGLHGAEERAGAIGLKAGVHELTVIFFQGGFGQELSVSYAGPGLDKQLIPASAYSHLPSTDPNPNPNPNPNPVPGGSGTGLLAEYFNNLTLTAPAALTQVDATIDMAWGNGSPSSQVMVDGFTGRWTGQIEAPLTGNYIFYTTSDDGVRLWVNGQLLINNWTDHGPTIDTSPGITLTAGQKYDIRLEYYENINGAVLRLLWALPGQGPQLVPKERLYPAGSSTPPPADLRSPDNPSNAVAGLNYQSYEGSWQALPDFGGLTPVKTGTTANIDLSVASRPNDHALRFRGYVRVPADGVYTFYTTSDDGSKLFIGSTEVVNNDGAHGPQEKSGSIGLKAGVHELTVVFFQAGMGQELSVSYVGPGVDKQLIPASAYSRLPSNDPNPNPNPLPPGNGTGLLAEYFNNPTLTAPVVLSRVDATIELDWGYNSPGSGINADGFSGRWTGQVEAPLTGSYTFSTISDDGVRLWVNNQLVINNWTDHGPTTDTSPGITLTAGQKYDIRLEYYDGSGYGTTKLLWTPPGQAAQVIPKDRLYPAGNPNPNPNPLPPGNGTGLLAEYFNNPTLTAPVVLSRVDATIQLEWGYDSPGSGINADGFSGRWSGQVEAPLTGSYTFSTVSDDGVRLWVNNQLVINNWGDHPPTTDTSPGITLTAGQKYDIRLEYYEGGGGALLQLLWTPPGQAAQVIPKDRLYPAGNPNPNPTPVGNGMGLLAEYFNNPTLTAPVVLSRVDATIDLNWGYDSPGSGINADGFSGRWSGQVEAPQTGSYTFSTVSDDGVRLWVNNQLVINNWSDHPPTTDTSPGITLTAGQKYDIRLEYYEGGGGALLQLLWTPPGQAAQVIPKQWLYPTNTPITSIANPGTRQLLTSTDTRSGRLAALPFSNSDAEASIKVYPVPAVDEITVKYQAEVDGELAIQITNSAGQKVKESKQNVVEGENLIRLPVRDINRGAYILIMTQDKRYITRKIILSE